VKAGLRRNRKGWMYMYTDQELKSVIDGNSIGSFFPYQGGSELEIESYIKTIVADLDRSAIIKADADYSMYGSGYASYVDIFCYKKDNTSTVQKGGVYYLDGIQIFISRLAPVAVFGKENRSKHKHGGSFGFIRPNSVGTTPEGDWEYFVDEIKRKLASYNISLLNKRYVSQVLHFETKITTILDDGEYKIFDAFFYWED
jgi:hypothetical protein